MVYSRRSQELLAAVDSRPWKSLAKRRVQHYGYEFCYAVQRELPFISTSTLLATTVAL